jgi:hypothetical protein
MCFVSIINTEKYSSLAKGISVVDLENWQYQSAWSEYTAATGSQICGKHGKNFILSERPVILLQLKFLALNLA